MTTEVFQVLCTCMFSVHFFMVFSTRSFQDLSLPIPTPDTLAAMRSSQQVAQQQQQDRQDGSAEGGGGGWLWWMWSWISGWFYGPNITLIDCLSYFFSADELKGDNMYSCDRCKLTLHTCLDLELRL